MLQASVLLLAYLPGKALAQDDAPPPQPVADATDDNGRSFAVIPGAFYSQETSVGFAALSIYTFPLRGTGEATWPSTFTGAVVYTLNNQVSASIWSGFYLGEANDWAIESETFVEHFPTNYYGIGPTSEPSYELFTRRQFAVDAAVRRRMVGQFYLGLSDHLSFVDILDVRDAVETDGSRPVVWTDDDQLSSSNVTGGEGTRTHGVGVLARWDTRDNNQSTRKGALIDVELAGYPTWIGTVSPFILGSLDMRGFITVGKGRIAGQWLTEIGSGDLPFTALPELGGDERLRGMFQGRFRDRSATSVQAELHHAIVWRFGGVAFAGAGQVAPSPERLLASTPRWTAGGGLRFEIDEDAHTNIRLDLGAGPDGTGFVFTFGEAF